MKSCAVAVVISALLPGSLFLSTAARQERGKPTDKKNRKTESVYAEIARAPERARDKRNVMENDPEAAAAGRILYEQRCAECHGNAGEGSKRGPSLRAKEVQNAEPGAIFWILTNGVVRKGMPVWSKLPEPQRWQLVSYIKSLANETSKLKTFSPATSEPRSAKDSFLPRR
jgi:mono/diheme cytochrome c family protein